MNARGFWQLEQVSDERLVADLTELLAGEGRTESHIVAHLAELDVRRLHLKGAQSLFHYCQRTLGLSDNQAYYRIAAARVARRFPIVFELLEQRAIHLTNIAPLSKLLTEENHRELLERAGRLSKRELFHYLACRAPRPDVRSHVRKLVPAAGAVSAGPTGSLEPLSETSYRLQLNTSQALKEKLELASDLMSHANPSGDLAVVVERALDLLVAKLRSRRFGQTKRPKPAAGTRGPDCAEPLRHGGGERAPKRMKPGTRLKGAALAQRVEPVALAAENGVDRSKQAHEENRVDRSKPMHGEDPFRQSDRSDRPKRESERRRAHIPQKVRRGLVTRDGVGCSYVSEAGTRCGARAFLQIHHETPWAKGGDEAIENLKLFCRAHNQLQAEQDYGPEHIARAIHRRRSA